MSTSGRCGGAVSALTKLSAVRGAPGGHHTLCATRACAVHVHAPCTLTCDMRPPCVRFALSVRHAACVQRAARVRFTCGVRRECAVRCVLCVRRAALDVHLLRPLANWRRGGRRRVRPTRAAGNSHSLQARERGHRQWAARRLGSALSFPLRPTEVCPRLRATSARRICTVCTVPRCCSRCRNTRAPRCAAAAALHLRRIDHEGGTCKVRANGAAHCSVHDIARRAVH